MPYGRGIPGAPLFSLQKRLLFPPPVLPWGRAEFPQQAHRRDADPGEQGGQRRRVQWRPALGRGRRGPTRFAPSPASGPGLRSPRRFSPAPSCGIAGLVSGRMWARSGSAFLGNSSAIIMPPFRPQPQFFPVNVVPSPQATPSAPHPPIGQPSPPAVASFRV